MKTNDKEPSMAKLLYLVAKKYVRIGVKKLHKKNTLSFKFDVPEDGSAIGIKIPNEYIAYISQGGVLNIRKRQFYRKRYDNIRRTARPC